MQKKLSLKQLENRYRRLAASLMEIGFILQGTITERIIHREGSQQGKRKTTYGPYYQWTFKESGKTRTVNLSQEQVPLFQEAIDNNRRLIQTLQEMRRLSREILEASTKGVKRRKSL